MNTPIDVPDRTPEALAPGLNLGDLYYIFFRHKGKILLIFIAGLLGAVGYYFAKPPMYQSEAKILIRYIVEGKTGTSAKDESQISPDSGGANIINSEIEILTSLDLAALVADAVGPEKILAKLGGGNDRLRAAAVIHKGLMVAVPGRSSVLLMTFRHPDAAVVQPVLSQLVDAYLKRHVAIHRGVGVRDDFFSRKTDELRSRLSTTEAELKKAKTEARVISVDESKRAYMDLMVKIRQELLTAEADLAERRTMLGEAGKPVLASTPATTNNESAVPIEQFEQYRRACSDLEALPKRLAELRTLYKDEHYQVLQIRQQLTEAERRKTELELAYPQLPGLVSHHQVDLPAESLRVAALEARIKELNDQFDKVRADASRVMDAEPEITQLQRRKELEESSFRFYSSSLEQARVDESLGTGEVTNISVVQTPSPPARDMKGVLKPVLVLLLVGCFGGFGLGFVSERILDRTIKGVADVERQVRVPLFLSVPDTTWQPGFHLPRSARNGHPSPATISGQLELSNGAAPAAPAGVDAAIAARKPAMAVAPWDPQHVLRTHFEALRDRLITYSEVRGMDHKPKMVAVTSYHDGAGVTTMAAGLAAALSETGDGNVLLVDMNLEEGAAHAFCQGKPSCGLSEALENSTRDPAHVQEKLYLVSAHETNNQKLPRVLPKRFAQLVPRMKASDYDYIIFDMPPVTQTSITARLAGFMDMVLVVIESEKTGQEIVQRANGLLHESRANVAAILNKHRAYVPHKFSQEL